MTTARIWDVKGDPRRLDKQAKERRRKKNRAIREKKKICGGMNYDI